MKCRVIDLGLIDYQQADCIQKDVLLARQKGHSIDTILLAEFYPVFTIGRLGDYKNLLIEPRVLTDEGIGICRVDRGGDITFHGPGQLVIYPIFNLADHRKDIRLYIRNLQQVIIDFLKQFGISGNSIDGKTGVWVNGEKIAQIGIGISKWTTYHGLSFNIDVDKKFFSMMHPCGLKNSQIINFKDLTKHGVALAEIKEKILDSFAGVFNLDLEYACAKIPVLA